MARALARRRAVSVHHRGRNAGVQRERDRRRAQGAARSRCCSGSRARELLAHGLLSGGAGVLRADARTVRLHRRDDRLDHRDPALCRTLRVDHIARDRGRRRPRLPRPVRRDGLARSSPPARCGIGSPADGALGRDIARLLDRAHLVEPHLLLHRRVRRHCGRRAAGARAGRDDLAAAAVLVHDGHRVGADPDGRRILRRAIRRLDHRNPRAHSGGGVRRRYLPRRLRDGAARAARARHSASRRSARSSRACW